MLKDLFKKSVAAYDKSEKEISDHNNETAVQKQKIIANHNNTRTRIAAKREGAFSTQYKLQ